MAAPVSFSRSLGPLTCPARMSELHVTESLHARRVRCSAWCGLRARGLHEPELIAIRVRDGHVAEPQVVIRGLGHDRPAITELRVPCVHVRDQKVNEPTYLTVAAVLG